MLYVDHVLPENLDFFGNYCVEVHKTLGHFWERKTSNLGFYYLVAFLHSHGVFSHLLLVLSIFLDPYQNHPTHAE